MNRKTISLLTATMLLSAVPAFANDSRASTGESSTDVAQAREKWSKVRDELPALLKGVLEQPLAPPAEEPDEKKAPPRSEDEDNTARV